MIEARCSIEEWTPQHSRWPELAAAIEVDKPMERDTPSVASVMPLRP